jgi:CO/xanthine dehydrogenase Mo-binding subunit
MEGGFVQGMSTALFESIKLKDGVMQNPSFVDYRIATSADAPREVEAIIVEVPQDDGRWGAHGIGEHALVPTISAIANAICDAVGVCPGEPSYLPEKMYLAMVDAGVVK